METINTGYNREGCWLQDLVNSQANIFRGVGGVGISLPIGEIRMPGTLVLPKCIMLVGKEPGEG